jgi:hypothetical protein
MRIIDKNKDYYDYLQGIYGIDELVVYDRRGSFPIEVSKPICDRGLYCGNYTNANFDRWFRREILYDDIKRKPIKIYNSNSVATRLSIEKEEKERERLLSKGHRVKPIKSPVDLMEGKILHFLLEIGFYHYIFEVERYIDDNDDKKLILKYRLIKKERVEKADDRVAYAPISILPITRQYKNVFKIYDDDKEQIVYNPILYSTYIPKFIDAKEAWNNLYEYISSLRDKEFEDTRTNDQHIESHGFHKKISFRHRK